MCCYLTEGKREVTQKGNKLDEQYVRSVIWKRQVHKVLPKRAVKLASALSADSTVVFSHWLSSISWPLMVRFPSMHTLGSQTGQPGSKKDVSFFVNGTVVLRGKPKFFSIFLA